MFCALFHITFYSHKPNVLCVFDPTDFEERKIRPMPHRKKDGPMCTVSDSAAIANNTIPWAVGKAMDAFDRLVLGFESRGRIWSSPAT